MFLEEGRHRKGDGGWLVLRVLPGKRPSFDGLILKRRTVDEQKPPVGSERCVVGPSKTPDPATPIACERRASSHAGSASVCRYCVYATNWYQGGMRCHEHWEPVLQDMIAERQWEQKGFFLRLWQAGLQVYDELEGIQWEWQAVDGAMTKAPLGKSACARQSDRSREERHQAQSLD